ncbi:MAG: RNA polymerase sigma factor [Dorea sp.]|uniref:RNA polymerase sigma factor n=1 Tax=Sporofaciens musculi TaxID=2681861 RepID=UPI002174624E|nr:RNA polymerase sigma factor [Sporofaciens musculi]MCI9423019.1 RNA polymerase sigma factor [Dorea sp.]
MRRPVQELFGDYQNNLYAAAFNVCKNAEDAKDVVQDTFIQYYSLKKDFDSEQHIRAWLFRVAINRAKNMNRTFWRRRQNAIYDD